ncbi:hypothetical protein [Brevibacillus dissolubilis]|uniref:hypothetical protein n=1 Tax=Brevibacillus dissolubilis TaxID=1844116 RepID=UPI00111779E7|nr:hypothetical protein [Brevibacillus dissolubilis]
MKKLLLLTTVLGLAATASGCTSYTSIDTEQVVQFEQDITSQYKHIDDVEMKYSPTTLHVQVRLDDKLSKEDHLISCIN